MKGDRVPILLSFHAIAVDEGTLVFGQLNYTHLKDLSFKQYSRRKTFSTLFRLYRTRSYPNQTIILWFGNSKIQVKTDAYGAFYFKSKNLQVSPMEKCTLFDGTSVALMEGLYEKSVTEIPSDTIVVTDIDDTLMHSYIFRKLMKFRTLMFTKMEKRKAVSDMQQLLHQFVRNGSFPIYLSNSEQNLYPLIYRFLNHNAFPEGPLFLKKWRGLWQVLWNIKFPLKNVHKQGTLKDLITFFPEKKFILMGDNTQHDLAIYLEAAEKFPEHILYIIIRKVVERKEEIELVEKHKSQLASSNIKLYYDDEFPYPLEV
jgi:phosphatidate phosphatase APP1